MDSNNNATTNNKPSNNATLDIRDIVNFLLSKIWIIALVILCFAIIAFLWTEFFISEEYTAKTDLFIISTTGTTNTDSNSSQVTSNQVNSWSIGKQLTKTSSELIMGDYCDYVAEKLNAHNPSKPSTREDIVLTKVLNQTAKNKKPPLEENVSFFDTFYSEERGDKGITGAEIRSHIKVSSDDETCIVSVTATTDNKYKSTAIANAVMALFDGYINDFLEGENGEDTVKTKIASSASVPTSPSNKNSTRNAIIFGVIGAVLVCAVLIVIFIFDDKIKTPDDIEKQLKLSVLGAIPEIEEE